MKTLTFSLERRFLVCYISVMYIPFPACMTDDSERILEIGVLWSVLHQGQVHLRVFAKDFDPFLPKEDLRLALCFECLSERSIYSEAATFLQVRAKRGWMGSDPVIHDPERDRTRTSLLSVQCPTD